MMIYKKLLSGDNMRKLAALSLGILMMASIGCGQAGSAKAPAIPADAKMLNMTLTDVDGKAINMRQYLGKVVIVDFWDTWCGPCKRGIPHFVELQKEYQDKGLVIVGVAFARQGVEAVKTTSSQLGVNYLNCTFNQEAQALFGSPPSIPTCYIINPQGEIHEKVVGMRDRSYFEERIKTLLKLS